MALMRALQLGLVPIPDESQPGKQGMLDLNAKGSGQGMGGGFAKPEVE